MPEEIITARAVVAMRQKVLGGLVVVLVLLAAWFGASWWQTHSAQGDLDDLQARGAALQQQTMQFGPLVTAQNDTTAIQAKLQKLMDGDLSWTTMLGTLRAKAPAGITFTQVSGSVTTAASGSSTTSGSGATGTGSYGSLNQTGLQQIGTLTIAGTATDKRLIADFNDKLNGVKGLTSPFITSVSADGRTTTFTITAIITTAALGGRYAAPATTGGAAVVPGAATTGSK